MAGYGLDGNPVQSFTLGSRESLAGTADVAKKAAGDTGGADEKKGGGVKGFLKGQIFCRIDP